MKINQSAAFQKIYEDNAADLLGYLQRSLRQETVARDLLQDAFLNFIRIFKEKDLPDANACRRYLFRSARNLMINHSRSSQTRLELVTADTVDVPSSRPSTEDMVLTKIDAELQETVLQQALSMIDETDRSILLMRHAHEMKLEEIATVVDLSISTVARRLDRTTALLNRLLKKTDTK